MKTEFSAENLGVRVDAARWSRMPGEAELAEAVDAISKRGIRVIVASSAGDALVKLKSLIPAGAEVMNGSSTTLGEIGYLDYLKAGKHGWKNMHLQILAEKDPQKQADLRRKAETSEYFIASVNAIAKTGELAGCDQSGSRVGAFPFAAKNLILVSGANKIVPDLPAALQRIREYVYPLENARAKKVYGSGTTLGKFVIISHEIFQGRTTLILVKEILGY
ncbi:MAG: lactate utilization protein [Candidatus ainarchaeum sp.]|nr:lactate utilization protein [Candidatus ainarchaeum sp.]